MIVFRQADAAVVWAPAKVNLYLEVLAKRADGYHEIATLMVAVSLFDTLEFKDDGTKNLQLLCDHPDLSTGPENLIVRAAQLLRQRTGCSRGARIRLEKRIPLGGGLAGGSSDAAATAVGLNHLWSTGLSDEELATLGSEIGSDVAFFLDAPVAWCTGRGEKTTAVRLGKVLWFVLACPSFGVSTAEVYRNVRVPDEPGRGSEMLQAVATGDVVEIGRRMHNRLQPVAVKLRPALAELEKRVASLGPAGHLLSGSGSTWFALCRNYGEACGIARELSTATEEGMNVRVFIVRSLPLKVPQK